MPSARTPARLTACCALGAVLLAPAPASAQVAELASGVQSFLLGGLPVFATLAIVIGGFLYITGRGSMQILIPAAIGIIMLASIGAIIGAASGSSADAMASLFLGWLRSAEVVLTALALAIVGYQHWFGRGSYQLVIPVAIGLFIMLSADWLVGRMGV